MPVITILCWAAALSFIIRKPVHELQINKEIYFLAFFDVWEMYCCVLPQSFLVLVDCILNSKPTTFKWFSCDMSFTCQLAAGLQWQLVGIWIVLYILCCFMWWAYNWFSNLQRCWLVPPTCWHIYRHWNMVIECTRCSFTSETMKLPLPVLQVLHSRWTLLQTQSYEIRARKFIHTPPKRQRCCVEKLA